MKDYYAISNGLTIGETFDASHPDLISTARNKGWLKKGHDFHFARCYSDWFYTTFSACRTRQSRAMERLDAMKKRMTVDRAMAHLRDHGDDSYRPDSHFLMKRICAHSAYPVSRHSAQTTGSLIAQLQKNTHTFWSTGTAAPCTSVFKPIWFTDKGLPDLGESPAGRFSPDSLWWRHELLHRSVLRDFNHRLSLYQKERNHLETEFIGFAEKADTSRRWEISQSAFKKCDQKIEEWAERISHESIRQHGYRIYRSYWQKQNKKAGVVVL